MLLILFLLMSSNSALAVDMDQDDKKKHVVASGAIALPTYLAMRTQDYSRIKSGVIAVSLSLLVGHIKEVSDSQYDMQDMEANAIGAFSGVVIPISFEF